MRPPYALATALVLTVTARSADSSKDFANSIRPVLVENCAGCHSTAKTRGPVNFVKAQTAKDIESERGVWRNVAAQLRNRTMPPVGSKLSEDDRLRVEFWIDAQLRQTACSSGPFAGAPAVRRLNRREYHNTIRDLLGIDFDAVQLFPADGTGGAGFDTNGETLFTPPMLMERYLEAAQSILDRVIVTPALSRVLSPESHEIPAGNGFAFPVSVYSDGDYVVQVGLIPKDPTIKLALKVDGVAAGVFNVRQPSRANNAGMPLDGRRAAREVVAGFLPRAFRRPAAPSELDRFLTLYDRAAERGDPWTERMKLMLRGVLVHPDFLFRIENRDTRPGIHALGQY